MKTIGQVYSVYVSDDFVELRSLDDADLAFGRFICSQTNYRNILEFASNLAKYKKIPFRNYTKMDA